MQIDHLSANIDAKLHRLEQQLANLRDAHERVADDDNAQRVIDRDIQILLDHRAKLLKSRDLAWQVHQISQSSQQQHQRDQRHRRLGLGLIIVSAVALAGLLALYLLAF